MIKKKKFTIIKDKYHQAQEVCKHKSIYVQDGIKYCQDCWKALEVIGT